MAEEQLTAVRLRLDQSPYLKLASLAGAAFAEPFFAQTVSRFQGMDGRRTLEGSWQEVLPELAGQMSLPVAAHIFHVGRCGSTLLMNALGRLDGIMALKEPGVHSSVALQVLAGTSAGNPLQQPVRAMFSICFPGVQTDDRVQIVKYSSWNVLAAEELIGLVGTAPSVFIWRKSAEVVDSMLRSRPAWLIPLSKAFAAHTATLPRYELPRILSRLDERTQFSTRMWFSMMKAGLALKQCGALMLSYESIAHDLAGTVQQVAKYANLDLQEAVVRQTAAAASATHSKGGDFWHGPAPLQVLTSTEQELIQDCAADIEAELQRP